MIGGRRRPVSRPSRRRCFFASSLVDPLTDRTSSLPFGSRTCTTVSGGSSGVSESGPAAASAEPRRRLRRRRRAVPPAPSASSSARPPASSPSADPADADASAPADGPADVSAPSLAAPSLAALVRRLRVREDGRLAPLSRLRISASLASLGFRLAVAGFRRDVLVAVPAPAAARPPPAAAPRRGAVVIVAEATGPVGVPAGPGGCWGGRLARRRGLGPNGLWSRRRRLEHHRRRLEHRRRHGRVQLAGITPARVVIEFSVVQLALEHSGNLQSGSRARGTAAFR